MTALTELQRLESPGAWRAGPDERLREVVVSFGDATLVLTDPKSDRPLTHWSLPAVARLNPGEMPALYSPAADSPDEQLEITEELMIDAIERVHRSIEARRAHPGRLRGGLAILAAIAMVLAGVIWLPNALVRYAARVAPPAQAAQVGDAVLEDITKSTGAACRRDSSDAVLTHLAGRLLPAGSRIAILPAQIDGARRLPGNVFILGENLVTDNSSPDLLAAHLLAASLAPPAGEPILKALEQAGLSASVQLLTSGQLPASAVQGYGEMLLSQARPAPTVSELQSLMAQKDVAAQPYLAPLTKGEGSDNAVTDSTNSAQDTPTGQVLTSDQWAALQRICNE